LAAFLIFLLAGIVGAAITYHDPDFKVNILGPQMVVTIDRHQMWTQSIVGIKPVASSSIMTNNLSVSFMTFASGIIGGVGTIYMMIFNGMLIGVIGTACFLLWNEPAALEFCRSARRFGVARHLHCGRRGATAGTRTAVSWVLPRRDSVTQAGAESVRLLLGTIPFCS